MKRIIIIGASSGIGRLIALYFARRGWSVGIAARRAELLNEIAAEYPTQIISRAFDASADDAPEQFKALIAELGGMDIALYAAGCGWYNPTLDLADDRRTISANVSGFTAIVDTAYAYFRQQGGGHIAAITSIAGTSGIGLSAAYSASKRYQWAYLQALEQLAREDKIKLKITDIRPGFIHTDLISRGPQHLPMTMPADYAATRMVRAILNHKRIKVIDCRWAIVTSLWRLLPRPLWRHFPLSKILK